MEDMAKRYAEGAHFLFVYTREAHPGEFYPPHQYYEQKLLHAASFRERLGVERTIVVDSLQGRYTACSAAYRICPGSSTTRGA